MTRIDWEIAGVDPRKRIQARILVPRWIKVVPPGSGTLCWSFIVAGAEEKRPVLSLLQQFISLDTSNEQKVLDFARCWGVLEICKNHRRPVCCGPAGNAYAFLEPIEAWTRCIRRFRAILDVAGSIKTRKRTNADWTLLLGVGLPERFEKLPGPDKLATVLNVLIGESAPRLVVSTEGGAWKADWTGKHVVGCGLFGCLVMQLVFAAIGSDGMYFCSSCGDSYLPPKRPNPKRNNYCPKCGRSAALRDAARRYRAKTASAFG